MAKKLIYTVGQNVKFIEVSSLDEAKEKAAETEALHYKDKRFKWIPALEFQLKHLNFEGKKLLNEERPFGFKK